MQKRCFRAAWLLCEGKPKGLLERAFNRIQENTRVLEEEQLKKLSMGQKARISVSLKEKVDSFFDQETILKQRKELMDTAFKHGYWDDAKEIAKKGAKLWEAPEKMRIPQLSPLMMDINHHFMDKTPVSLLEYVKSRKYTILGLYCNQFGEKHVQSFLQQLAEYDYIKLNVVKNAFQAPVMRLLVPYQRFFTPKQERGRIITIYKDITLQLKQLGMHNTSLGWINIIDGTGRIRWQAHGIAADHEISTIKRCIEQLENPTKSTLHMNK